ncbi:hypothetical protein FMN63_12295 [Stappia sp. BW2]|uniref:hypothetical protein n=1 Tax=Stappia sp. BW2 TaxID=2592622 RepID=UPI0011DE63DB|nr:hypothetical protein [Stappia sp. BW2]TYC66889.1 hypothetical protein FMN63_12295 [Stappia sp. BW2]
MDDMLRSATNIALAFLVLIAAFACAPAAYAQTTQDPQLPAAPLLNEEEQQLNQSLLRQQMLILELERQRLAQERRKLEEAQRVQQLREERVRLLQIERQRRLGLPQNRSYYRRQQFQREDYRPQRGQPQQYRHQQYQSQQFRRQ